MTKAEPAFEMLNMENVQDCVSIIDFTTEIRGHQAKNSLWYQDHTESNNRLTLIPQISFEAIFVSHQLKIKTFRVRAFESTLVSHILSDTDVFEWDKLEK
jgi:hypothetical protein